MKKHKFRPLSTFFKALTASLFVIPGIVSLCTDINGPMSDYIVAEAAPDPSITQNKIYFDESVVQTNDSNLIYVNLTVEGVGGSGTNSQFINVTYSTQSVTGIDSVDFTGTTNTLTFEFPEAGRQSQRICIKVLNDASNREILRLTDLLDADDTSANKYGRYFNLKIDKVTSQVGDSAPVDITSSVITGRGVCKCFLPYSIKDNYVTVNGVSYLNEYNHTIWHYNSGRDDIDGGEVWKSTWEGFNYFNDCLRSARWMDKYVSTGLANAYATFLASNIDDTDWQSNSDIVVTFGNLKFARNYDKKKKKYDDDEGCMICFDVDPDASGGYRLDLKAMDLVARGKNPTKTEDRLINGELHYVNPNHKYLYFRYNDYKDPWWCDRNSLVGTQFFKIEPYEGTLYTQINVYNTNSEWDREIKNIWKLARLVDDTAPTIVGQWAEFDNADGTAQNRKIKIFVRYSEPVYTPNKYGLVIKLNGKSTTYSANYVEGNYSDTLVYEMTPPDGSNITSMTYTLPYTSKGADVCDLSYSLDSFGVISNNRVKDPTLERDITILGGNIDLTKPSLSATPAPATLSGSIGPKNVFQVSVNTDDNGYGFREGTAYYMWDSNETITDPTNPDSYVSNPETGASAGVKVLTETDQGVFDVTLANKDAGNYYLHVLVVSKYGDKAYKTFGKYVLDARTVNATLTTPTNNLKEKTYDVTVANKASPSTSIKTVTLNITYTKDGEEITENRDIVVDGETQNLDGSVVSKTETTDNTKYSLATNIDTTNDFISNLMGEDKRLECEVSFTVTDVAGNRTTTDVLRTAYDERTTFGTTVTVPLKGSAEHGYVEDHTVTSITVPVYDIKDATSGQGITFSLPDGTAATYVGQGAIFSLVVNGKEIKAGANETSITLLGDYAKSGFYQVAPHVSGTATSGEVDLISDTVAYYLTNSGSDATPNKAKVEGNIVLSNKVYQVSNATYVFYDKKNNVIANHLYGAVYDSTYSKYNGGSASPTFSDFTAARTYFRYMELQDLYLLQIDDVMAQYMNMGVGSNVYLKASGETKIAQAGQLWIRYKRNTWNNSIRDENGWAFYYYGTGNQNTPINYTGLSENLQNAINDVVNTICSTGTTIYLVDDEHLNASNGAPYLLPAQTHENVETVTESKSGSAYDAELTYSGDSAIYKNTVTYENVQYPLANNVPLTVDSSTSLFVYVSDTWKKIEASDGTTIRGALQSSLGGNVVGGVYRIREYSDYGVGDFEFYIEGRIPTVQAIIDGTPQIISTGTATRISCPVLVLQSISDTIDEQAYVAVYSYPNKRLQNVYYAGAVENVTLTNSNYYVQIGDRCGNNLLLTVFTSDTEIDATIDENSTKTSVIVRVKNRVSAEIYSYDVYLNEVLIDTTFAETKVFRDSGIYRVVIRDIYGKNKTLTLEHNSPTPSITWYYENDNGMYVQYDPATTTRMRISEDPDSSRTTLISSASLVRARFNASYEIGNFEYEMLDLESTDYVYNTNTNILTIKTLKNWRLRVWYSNTPEADRIYSFSVDSEAPQFDLSYIGDTYRYNQDSYIDYVDLTGKEAGDVLSLGSLGYTNSGKGTLKINDGDIIFGSQINVSLTDNTMVDLKTIVVTRDGKVVLKEPDKAEFQLLGYGRFIISVSDIFGNTGRFEFVNVNAITTNGYVDGTAIRENTNKNYGNNNLEVENLYDGKTTILVTSPSKKSTLVFEHYDGIVSYGYYYVNAETVGEETVLSAELRTAGVVFDNRDDRYKVNTWYPVVRDVYFIINAMVDSDGHVHYRTDCVSGEISIECRSLCSGNKIPNRYYAVFSKETPSVDLYTGGDLIEKTTNEYIYIADDLTIGNVTDEHVTKVQVAYNTKPEYSEEDYVTVYENGTMKEYVGTKDGFYQVVVTNIYNNKKIYNISKIDTFNSVVKIHVIDGSEVIYTKYPDPKEEALCSNYMIELIIYSDEIIFDVNGVSTSGFSERGTTTLALTSAGKYDVRVNGKNGIFQDFRFEIKNDDKFVYDEDWITGYNKEALLASEKYTNTKCDIHVGTNVIFIDMVVNDDLYVKLYDNITDSRQTDLKYLEGAIGSKGDGKYTVGFRNKYGDLVKQTVYYSATPGLQLTRRTTANPDVFENYDLDLAVSKGFQSNYVLSFATTSKEYRFTVNGERYTLETPKIIEFSNISGHGSFSYHVTFVDEYGNNVEFDAILNREDVELDASKMKIINLNNEAYTKSDVLITFADNLTATVSVDGGDEIAYTSGHTFYKDGKYRFVVEDIAGNQNIYTVTHKSMNHYSLVNTSNNASIIPGGVINHSSVTFSPTDDSRIKNVYLNGELQEEYKSNTFSTTGHWELIIEDVLGNRSYESFYIINNSLNRFTYNAPYDFEISEVWKVSEDGSRDPVSSGGESVTLTGNGNYVVVVANTKTASSFNYTVTIDDTAPKATLVGAENGGVTARDVSLANLSSGDIVKIYKNNQLVSSTTVKIGTEIPKITTSGNYKITITNVQGVTIEYDFVRRPIASITASVFVIITCALAIVGMGVGLIYHTKLKADD